MCRTENHRRLRLEGVRASFSGRLAMQIDIGFRLNLQRIHKSLGAPCMNGIVWKFVGDDVRQALKNNQETCEKPYRRHKV